MKLHTYLPNLILIVFNMSCHVEYKQRKPMKKATDLVQLNLGADFMLECVHAR